MNNKILFIFRILFLERNKDKITCQYFFQLYIKLLNKNLLKYIKL